MGNQYHGISEKQKIPGKISELDFFVLGIYVKMRNFPKRKIAILVVYAKGMVFTGLKLLMKLSVIMNFNHHPRLFGYLPCKFPRHLFEKSLRSSSSGVLFP